MLLRMRRLFVLAALLALVFAPFAFATASAATADQASHCTQAMAATDHGQHSVPQEVGASCCPAAASAALPAEPVRVAGLVVLARPSYRAERLTVPQTPRLPFEPPPPRAA